MDGAEFDLYPHELLGHPLKHIGCDRDSRMRLAEVGFLGVSRLRFPRQTDGSLAYMAGNVVAASNGNPLSGQPGLAGPVKEMLPKWGDLSPFNPGCLMD